MIPSRSNVWVSVPPGNQPDTCHLLPTAFKPSPPLPPRQEVVFTTPSQARFVHHAKPSSSRASRQAKLVSCITPSQARITPSQARLALSQARLASSQARITPSQARITPSQARLAPSQARLAPSQARLAPSQARLAPSQARPAPSQARPAPSQARPASRQARPASSQARPASNQARSSSHHVKPTLQTPSRSSSSRQPSVPLPTFLRIFQQTPGVQE
ncbi:probable serine/threonine-protein kinase samkC [Oryzias melastigma]|uniref:probable serine/threonine-protein kinase samkC n=1 Tax=Oryzias melastigma TaxID=30732 RepID=UPI00168CACF2|nr:probable serine/threonine-protein kinase samkC [Oryzias melastigma]